MQQSQDDIVALKMIINVIIQINDVLNNEIDQ